MSLNTNPLNNGSYWGPVGESPDEILLEQTFMASAYLMGMGFAAQFVIYVAAMRQLWSTRHSQRNVSMALMVHSTLMCLANFFLAIPTFVGIEQTYVNNRNFPGGPLGYIGASEVLWFDVLSVTGLVFGNILADFLLLWRCRVIWTATSGSRTSGNIALIFPTIIALCSFAMGLLWDIQSAIPSAFFSTSVEHVALAFFTLSLSLNVILTGMIMYRIWIYQRMMSSSLSKQYAAPYTSLSAMFVESAALYTVVSIPVLVTFALNSPLNQIFLGIEPATQICCSYFIILRVANGKAWSRSTVKGNNTTVVFNKPSGASNTMVGASSGGADESTMFKHSATSIPLNNFSDGDWERK